MLGLANTLTTSSHSHSQGESIPLVDPGSWILYSLNQNNDTRYVNARGYINNSTAIDATDYNTNTPLAIGNRINMANGDPLTVQVTFRRMQSTAPGATVLAETTGTAYLYRVSQTSSATVGVFHLSPVNATSQTAAQLSGVAGSGTFDLTTFGDNNGCTPTVGSGSVSSIYRFSITVDQNPPFSSSATFNISTASLMDTVA